MVVNHAIGRGGQIAGDCEAEPEVISRWVAPRGRCGLCLDRFGAPAQLRCVS